MSEESVVVVVCSNPKCQREIETPILLTVHSVTPPEQYEACPYCFTKIEPAPPEEQEELLEPKFEQEELMDEEPEFSQPGDSVLEKVKDSGPRFLQKFKSLIPSSDKSRRYKTEKPEEPQADSFFIAEEKPLEEELETEPLVTEVPEMEPRIEAPAQKECESSGCPGAFGYLANRPPNTPVPQQCLVCPKMVDCMLCPREH